MAAAKCMLDEIHGSPQSPPSRSDDNSYLLGSIWGHKIAVACLPMHEVGPSPAALVATNMLSSFSNIRLGLIVGIGGGTPNYGSGQEERDIRLGDAVISSDSQSGGVVAYNFGKILGDGSFEVCYALDRPPRLLRTALSRLETDHMTRDNYIADHIQTMLERCPRMRNAGFGYPQHAIDIFFDADYRHVGRSSCRRCDPTQG